MQRNERGAHLKFEFSVAIQDKYLEWLERLRAVNVR